MSGVRGRLVKTGEAGYFKIFARPPRGQVLDITTFRGTPTTVSSWAFTDPFGPSTLELQFPTIGALESIGANSVDLWWLTPDTSVDVVWHGPLPAGYPDGAWRWEGFFTSPNFDGVLGMGLECIGAMRQLDHYQAKPEYLSRPLPYEVAIGRQFEGKPDLRLAKLQTIFPPGWERKYVAAPAKTPPYMVPVGVSDGQPWTGMLTRQSGSWDPVLTSYIQQMITSMYTESGRWTLDLLPGRVPVLRHRELILSAGDTTLVVDPVSPDVRLSLSIDWSQRVNVAYGQGRSLSGTAYSGMTVTADGLATSYEPLAASRSVHPVSDKHGWFDKTRMRKEVVLQLQPGLDAQDAARSAAAHLGRFGEPGITGTITLGTDVRFGAEWLPRSLIKAGMTVQVPGLLGAPEGVVFAITQVSVNLEDGKTTLTVDSKFRDQLTVQEVRLRGRDALSVTRMLIGGQYQPPVPDQLLPWNYAEGSGFIPSGPQFSAKRLFEGMPTSVQFPWTEWTRVRPPKSASWSSCYIKMPRYDGANANGNWASLSDRDGARLGFPVKMAQAGQIRLVQIAAYDPNGEVAKVSFHVSLYYSRGVNALSMPIMPAIYAPGGAEALPGVPYAAGQRYPFFPNAWETYKADGTRISTETPVSTETAGLIVGWGNHFERAGHWPGSFGDGDPATGLLVDEEPFSFDTSTFDSTFDPYSPTKNASNPLAGNVYVMIYCDTKRVTDLYFVGRMFRVEPGVSV